MAKCDQPYCAIYHCDLCGSRPALHGMKRCGPCQREITDRRRDAS